MKRVAICTAALALAIGCVPEGGSKDGDPGMSLDAGIQGNNGNGNGNGNGGPRVGGAVNYAGAGVASGDQVDELTDDQRQAACDAMAAAFGNALSQAQILEFSCGIQGLVFSGFSEADPVGTCRMIYDECRANPDDLMLEEGDGECPLVGQPECTATLGEIEACIQDSLQGVVAFIDDFDCALAADVANLEDAEDLGGSPACELLETKCPGLLDDEDEDFVDGDTSEDPFAQ